ncbi:hypothetical protein MARA_43910 [Mycolicibacterium arabiense]|uniref:Uncharacterized protein n=1 Tax=Mycolicibacterium arabiense TaxID=1286181 RepID=A0A7I7S2K5_9MYCO|nr:hypothetical protein [Mycolicibacterium arabiense]BBY50923.1 hypothetical protein MARA_43910 [Mycolicibacterium arabiense]
MVTRARIAAAACLVASGLLVTGGSASLAFASPEDGTSGDTAGGTTGTGTGQAADPTGTAPTPGTTPGSTTGSTGTSGPATGPTSTVGNGRNDVEPTPGSGTVTGTPSTPTASKPPEPPLSVDPQTGEDPTGELGEADPEATAKSGSDPSSTGTPSPAAAVEAPVTEPAVAPDPVVIVPGQEGLVALADPTTPEELVPAFQWPWSWWFNAQPPSGDSGGGGSTGEQPVFNPPRLPQMQLPRLQFPDLTQLPGTLTQIPGQWVTDFTTFAQPWLEAVTGLATAASQLPFQPITLPVFPPGTGAGAGPGGGGGGANAGGATIPGVPRLAPPAAAPRPEGTPDLGKPAEQAPLPEQQPTTPVATAAGNQLLPAPTYRMGYVEYLRAAGLGQVAAVAVPGVTGILVLTGAGGLIGYRQARAGRAVHAGGPARFMG